SKRWSPTRPSGCSRCSASRARSRSPGRACERFALVARVDGWVVLPEPARGEHRVRIFGSTAAAVVAAEREEQVAALALEVVAQDDAAEAQVGLHVKEPAGIAVADRARPKRHHLRVAARARDRDRVLAKVALDL